MKNEVLVQALGKLDEEMQKSDAVIKLIHEHIEPLLYVADEKVLIEIAESKKTLKGALDAMRGKAKENAVNNIGVLSDEEGYKICRDYFGIVEKEEKPATAMTSVFDLI